MRAMTRLWEMKGVPQGTHSPNLRNRAAFALQHQTLVSYSELLTLDLVDSFTEYVDISHEAHRGSSLRAPGLALSIRYGRQMPDKETPIAVALRHKNHGHCSISALAFHFFDRFQVSCFRTFRIIVLENEVQNILTVMNCIDIIHRSMVNLSRTLRAWKCGQRSSSSEARRSNSNSGAM